MTDRVWKLNSDILPNEWGAQYGLKETGRVTAGRGIRELVDGRRSDLKAVLDGIDKDHPLEWALLDHPRKFRVIGETDRVVAVVTSPYLINGIKTYGSESEVNHRIHELARSIGLNVRVGHPSDVMYLSNVDGLPTLPIVWWAPDRIKLPFPPVRDPNPDYASRMENSSVWER